MSRLYDYYSGMEERLEDGETLTQPIAFSRYQNAYIHLVTGLEKYNLLQENGKLFYFIAWNIDDRYV